MIKVIPQNWTPNSTDLRLWSRENYIDFCCGAISKEEYEAVKAELDAERAKLYAELDAKRKPSRRKS